MNQPLECENDLLASYYCIECSKNICEQCIDAHKKVKLKKKTYFVSFSYVKTVKKTNLKEK